MVKFKLLAEVGSEKPLAKYCSRCCRVSDLAATACVFCDRLCSYCQEPVEEKGHFTHEACRKEWAVRREVERRTRDEAAFAKAKKIPLSKYTGKFLYHDAAEGNEGYFPTDELSDTLCRMHERGLELPAYAWACTPQSLMLEARVILEGALEQQDFFEDAIDHLDHVDELQVALDAWLKKQPLQSYWQDERVAVLIGDAVEDLRKELETADE